MDYEEVAEIDEKIEDSIIYDHENFWFLNNGITIVCDDFKFVDNEIHLTHFSILIMERHL